MSRSTRTVRAVLGCAAAVVLASTGSAAQDPPPCPSCVDAAALVRRFQLAESETPVRERAGWSAPRRVVTLRGAEWAAALRKVAPGAEVIGVDNLQAAVAAMPGADVYVGLCTPEIVAAGTSLRWIQLVTAGADSCAALPAISEGRILITNAQAVFAPQIADQAMGLLLGLTRRLPKYHDQQRARAWSHPPADVRVAVDSGYWELEGKSMLVLGLGGIGTEIARRGHAFGMRVRATRNSSREGPEFVEYVGLSDEALTLAGWADVVVNALPLTPQTRGTVDAQFLAAMKPTAYLINIGRGETVVTADLVDALRRRRIAGAGLDVTDPEPLPPDHPLWTMPNVVLTPHTAGASDQIGTRLLVLAQENLRRYVNGERMLSVVNPQRGY